MLIKGAQSKDPDDIFPSEIPHQGVLTKSVSEIPPERSESPLSASSGDFYLTPKNSLYLYMQSF
jgi:hypothetical protein